MRSNSPSIAELPYFGDSAGRFEAIADQPWSVFIDSGYPHSLQGRYDLLAAEPRMTLITRGGLTEIQSPERRWLSAEDPFELVRRALGPQSVSLDGIPFPGGAIGYFSYDLGRRLERLPQLAEDAEQLPEMAVGIYDWAVVVDHAARRSWLVGGARCSRSSERWQQLLGFWTAQASSRPRQPFRATSELNVNIDRAEYGRLFRRIKRYIRDGDCYQVNLARRFCADVEGDLWSAYTHLRQINPAPHAAYLNYPFASILSASPERFLRVHNGHVETKPIKGTRRRHADRAQDAAMADALQTSPKDRAENLMIVDLLRNDLGKSCAIGSVRAPALFQLESFATVHHLVSTVTGTLAPGRDALDVLRSCFPGGSITGAPKLRAMEIIEELEPHRRGVYCGSVGYIGFDGGMDTNIAIRTLVHSGRNIRFWAGGGIVADSDEEAEYQETNDKAAAMIELLGCPDMGAVGS
jgi:para-aminobenzoate synthetase component 1